MDTEQIQVIFTFIIIIATVFNVFLVYKNYSIKKPVISIKLDNLPPYTDKEDKTSLTIKNVGTKGTGPDIEAILSCSWMEQVSLRFNLPSKGSYLDPNEEIIWKFRMDENYPISASIYIEVIDRKNNYVWELSEQI